MLSNLIPELRATTKPSEKKDILVRHDSPELREVLDMCYNPFRLFHVKITEKDIPVPGENSFDTLYPAIITHIEYCEGSNSNKENRLQTISLLEDLDKTSQYLLVGILNKNLQAGLGSTLVLEVLSNLFPVFEVQLANKYEKYLTKKKRPVTKWLCTPKLDGVRCVALYTDNKWSFISRQGHPFLTVDHLIPDFEKLRTVTGYTFWDGELYKHGLSFEEIQGSVMSFTKGSAPDIEFHTFVTGKAEDFLAQKKDSIMIVEDPVMKEGIGKVKAVDVRLIDEPEVYSELELAFEQGYEGIMLRDPNCLYDYKRSDALLKLKRNEASALSEEKISDCLVTEVIIGSFPVVEEVEGKNRMVTKQLLVDLMVLQKNGILCKVGSGFDLPFRYKYAEDSYDIINTVVEIRHQGYGKLGRMRFPTFYRERRDLNWEGLDV